MEDAIPQEVKQRRLCELIEQQKNDSQKIYQALVGTEQQVLVEGHSKKDIHQATGKIDRGRTVNFNQGTKPAMPGDLCEGQDYPGKGKYPVWGTVLGGFHGKAFTHDAAVFAAEGVL